MNRTLQLGDTQVDGTSLAEVCRRYGVKELSLFGSAVRGDLRAAGRRHVARGSVPSLRCQGASTVLGRQLAANCVRS